MIRAKRLLDSECMAILLPEAYDVYSISDWAIWEIVEGKTVSYALVTRTGPRVREIYQIRVSTEELSQKILDLAQGVDE